jgi:hypothetical protein
MTVEQQTVDDGKGKPNAASEGCCEKSEISMLQQKSNCEVEAHSPVDNNVQYVCSFFDNTNIVKWLNGNEIDRTE